MTWPLRASARSAIPVTRDSQDSREPGHRRTAVLFADGDVPAAELLPIGELTAFGAADVYSVQAEHGYAPAAWARGLAELTVSCAASAVVAAATDRGPHRQQVGQTGAKISPERYLACGSTVPSSTCPAA